MRQVSISSLVTGGLLGSAPLQKNVGLGFSGKSELCSIFCIPCSGLRSDIICKALLNCRYLFPWYLVLCRKSLFRSILGWKTPLKSSNQPFSCFLSCIPAAKFLKPSENVIFPDLCSAQHSLGGCSLGTKIPKA